MAIMQSRNPATGEVFGTIPEHTSAEIEAKLEDAAEAYEIHRRTPLEKRAQRLRAAADILEQSKGGTARLMTMEMGKPFSAAIAEVEKCVWVCRYYADNAAAFLADESVEIDGRRAFVRYQPIGPVLAIMPWNFPLWQVFRFAAPALMAGNVGLLKHAANVPQCALAIEDVFREARFHPGVFQALLVSSSAVEAIIRDARVRAVTLTGSDRAGSAVARTAGESIKTSVLELGGNDPFIVMPSADLDNAVTTAVTARTINNGQSCIAAKRFIVHVDIFETFAARFTARMKELRVGDPMNDDTDIGPLATEDIRNGLHEQVRASLERGARLLTGGSMIDGPGWYYPPTVLTDIPPDSPAYREELFGPVASLFRATDIDDAIRIANDSMFGLGSAAFTNDAYEQGRFADEIEAGLVFINGMVASDPRLPFGGVKRSGYGRELGRVGIHEFCNIKSVVIGDTPAKAAAAE
jgi:succinate-semialdehyde dehydrogenase/glutarate-semialdehyde dehydrogenase